MAYQSSPRRLSADRSAVLVIDLQEKLTPAVPSGEDVVQFTESLLEAADLLGVPSAATLQYPKGLGGLVDPILGAILLFVVLSLIYTYVGGVKVDRMADDAAPPRRVSDPRNPLADKDGYVYQSNVSEVTEMVEMMAAARSYQNNVEVINTARQLMMRTLDISKA